MSYRHLRAWKSLGPDHGFSTQLQPRPGPRAEAAPLALVKGRNIGNHEKVVLILRIKEARFWFHGVFDSHVTVKSMINSLIHLKP